MLTGAKSRRSHHKSRNGCEECKLRRNKCDEQGYPDGPCAACVIRGTVCVYRRGPQMPSRSSTIAQSSGTRIEDQATSDDVQQSQIATQDDHSSASRRELVPTVIDAGSVSASITPEQAQSLRIQDLRLLHFWCTRTCHNSNSHQVTLSDQWRGQITIMAFDHPFLLNTILAVTSVHLAIEENDSSTVSNHISTAIHYQTLALTEFRIALGQLSPENSNAVLACAVLNMICAHVSSQLPTPNFDHISTPLEAIPVLFDALTGIRGIRAQCESSLKSNEIWDEWGFGIEDHREGDKIHDVVDQQMQAEVEEVRTALARLRRLLDSAPVNERLIYKNAIIRLQSFFLIGTGTVAGWLLTSGASFMEHVRTQRPMALMILMHWSILVRSTSFEWWTRFFSPRLTRQLSDLLRSRDKGTDWREAVRWCQSHSEFALTSQESQ